MPIIQYNFMRVISIFAVVVLHSAAPMLSLYNSIPTTNWHIGNFYDSIVRWCVPVFFMLSGALLLDPNKNESIKHFFTKRLIKVIPPFIFWSLVFYVFANLILGKNTIDAYIIIDFTKKFFTNGIYYHLWFVYVIIGLYILTPLLRIFIKHSPKNMILYFLTIWFIGGPIANYINYLFDINIAFKPLFDINVGYFVLGYYLRVTPLNKKTISLIYLLGMLSLLITFFGTYFETVANQGAFIGFYYDSISPNSVLVSIAVFVFIQNLKLPSKLNAPINFFSASSFGVFFIHALILDVFNIYLDFNPFTFLPLFSIPILAIVTFMVSTIIIHLLRKVKFIKTIIS
ncbi:acyltransferase [Lysinibacillus sp. NPDC047702]|uniref:acyltransferase n=1 Tax=unclassified Lysinibacillus TaxID=2636778 RepID=UPI003D073181